MDEKDKLRLRKNRVALIQDLKAEHILDILIQDGIINTDDVERIRSKTTSRDRTGELLDIIPTRGPRAYRVFRQCLEKDYSWLGELLDSTDVNPKLMRRGPNSEKVKISEPFETLNHPTCKLVAENCTNMIQWKRLAEKLGLTPEQLGEVEYRYDKSIREQVYQMLVMWRDSNKQEANVGRLKDALRLMNYEHIADRLDGYIYK